jgi:hypothetical protein
MNNQLTKREIESLADQPLALLDQIDSGDLRATPGMRHRIEGALIGPDIALGRSLEETPVNGGNNALVAKTAQKSEKTTGVVGYCRVISQESYPPFTVVGLS